MEIALPKICPVLGYDNPSGLWRCQRCDEDIWTKAYETLKEHGWNVPHNTLAPTLGGLVRDGYLVKLEGIKPAKYRLPNKVKLNVTQPV